MSDAMIFFIGYFGGALVVLGVIAIIRSKEIGRLNDELTRLRTLNTELVEALGKYLYETTHLAVPVPGFEEMRSVWIKETAIAEARAAIAKAKEQGNG